MNQDQSYWEGFDDCIKMIKNYLENCEHVEPNGWASITDEIDEEAELYKKDG